MHVEVEQRAGFPSCVVNNKVAERVVLENQLGATGFGCGKFEFTHGMIKSSWIAVTQIDPESSNEYASCFTSNCPR